MSDDTWPTLLQNVLEYVTLLTNLGDCGGDDAALGQGDEDEGSLGHPAGRAAANAAGGAAKGEAPPAGRKKK